jgi:multiple sugar transport system substrate-binding protein
MRRLLAALGVAAIVASCGGSGVASPSSGAVAPGTVAAPVTTPGAPGTPAVTPVTTQPPAVKLTDACAAGGAGASPAAPAGGVNSWAAGISGEVKISGWQSTGAEGEALTQTLCAAQKALPNLQITYQPIVGDYQAVMAGNIAAHDVPDLFYVNADYAAEWIDQGFLLPLDDYISKSAFDTSQFFDGYASIFKSKDGKWFGFPKDGNTIGLASNSDLVKAAPKTLDELTTMATALKGKGSLTAPLCLNASLDRALAFIDAQGGSLLNADGTAAAIDSDASRKAVQWYMDLFKQGLGKTASDMGDDWCGKSLATGHAGMIFEGGWLDPFMTSTYPDVKYAWAPVPTGSSGKPVTLSFTVSYSIGADAQKPDQAFALLTYLAGPQGMATWTQGGVALPSRKDVPTPQGKDVLTAESPNAKPGSGFMAGYTAVQKAFSDAFTHEIQQKTYDAGPVVSATKAAIDKALSGQ